MAGSGKTTMMAAARTAWEGRGLVVAGAATAAVAATNLHAEAGIPSTTIATWLLRIKGGRGLSGVDVLVVDEASMVDDRQMAALLAESARTGTKIVPIGDPLQLRAAGVGGGFAAIHRQVAGLTLKENRRQRDPLERKALERWRAGGESERPQDRQELQRQALRLWGQGERVRAGQGAEDTMAQLLADWLTAREPYRAAGTPEAVHDELAQVLVLAGTNAAVDRLNAVARELRRERGELEGPDHRYRLPGRRTIALAIGDHVRVRKNDYRARRGVGAVNVLNGYRGHITAIGADRRVEVEWRQAGPDGPTVVREWLTPDYIASGGLSHGTAMTVAAAEGLTADHALIYGMGLDPHTLYAAMTRDRERARLYLPRELLESDFDRVRHGKVRSEADALQRALAAYAATLDDDRVDRLLTPEPEPIAQEEQDARQPAPATVEREDRGRGRGDRQRTGREQEKREAAAASLNEARAAIQLAGARLALSRSAYGVGLLSDDELTERLSSLAEQVEAASTALEAAEQERHRYARNGGGPTELALLAERDKLAANLRRVEAAERAERRLQQARQQILEGHAEASRLRQRESELAAEVENLGSLLPSHRARRRELTEVELPQVRERLEQLGERLAPIRAQGPALEQAARESVEQAPPRVVWSMIRRRHDDLVGDFAAAQRGARSVDVTNADSRAATARLTRDQAQEELAAGLSESERRADLPPDQRDIEQRVRSEEASRRRTERERDDIDRERRSAHERSQRRQTERDREPSRQSPASERDVPSR
ncbi:AAA family ATPase [Nonomuraea africana]|uniref:AAA family ATPase n=1 Tax=Nonomuraea africana TaxID=46171 RepID=UPI0033DE1FB9